MVTIPPYLLAFNVTNKSILAIKNDENTRIKEGNTKN